MDVGDWINLAVAVFLSPLAVGVWINLAVAVGTIATAVIAAWAAAQARGIAREDRRYAFERESARWELDQHQELVSRMPVRNPVESTEEVYAWPVPSGDEQVLLATIWTSLGGNATLPSVGGALRDLPSFEKWEAGRVEAVAALQRAGERYRGAR